MQRKTILIAAATLAAISLIIFIFRLTGAGKKAAETRYPEGAYVYKPAKETPAVALVLDDCGYTKKNLEDVSSLGIPVTLAVLPNTPYAKEVCRFADDNGIEVILHMPMEPEGKDVALEKDTLFVEMEPGAVSEAIGRAFESVPSAKGMNNHMGSKFTSAPNEVHTTLAVLQSRDLLFVDSLTSSHSVAYGTARRMGMSSLCRNVFIDHRPYRQSVFHQLKRLERRACRHGMAVGIGLPHIETLHGLRRYLETRSPEAPPITTVSALV